MANVNRGSESDGDDTTRDFPRLTAPLRPVVDLVARLQVGVNAKLLPGFLVGAMLLLGMGILSLVVIERMGDRVADWARMQV